MGYFAKPAKAGTDLAENALQKTATLCAAVR